MTDGSEGKERAAAADDGRPRSVTAAVGLGWQMAELYSETQGPPIPDAELSRNLPGHSALGWAQLFHVRFGQVLGGIGCLTETIVASGLDPVGLTSRVGNALERLQEIRDAAESEGLPAAPATPDEFCPAVWDLHLALLATLTAADPRVGKAYGLGRALADLCLRPEASDRARFVADFEGRVSVVTGWLGDLKSVLPRHSGESVRRSLQLWETWLHETPDDDEVWSRPAPWQDPLHPRDTASLVTYTLVSQGTRWRAVLTGEKAATALLSSDDFIAAGGALLQRFRTLAWEFWRRNWPWASLASVALVGASVALILLLGRIGGAVTTLGIVASGVGIVWRATSSTLGRVVSRAEAPLWGAQLDLAVTKAVTILPNRSVSLTTPPRKRLFEAPSQPRVAITPAPPPKDETPPARRRFGSPN